MERSKVRKLLNLCIKIAILVLSYLYIYIQFGKRTEWQDAFAVLPSLFHETTFILTLMAVFGMMLLNWSLEAIKWRYLIRKTEQISFLTACRAVLAGITVSTFTPNRIGEYFGRVFILKKTQAWEGAFMTVVGSMSQLLVTILVGSVGLVVFMYRFAQETFNIPTYLFWCMVFAIAFIDVILLLFYFNIRVMEPVLKKFTLKRWVRIREQLQIFHQYSARELFYVWLMSLARYAVFSTQYFILLRLFHIPIGFFDGLMIVSCIYLLMTAVPSMALSELGIRGSLAMFFFGLYFGDNYLLADTVSVGAVMASFLIWVLNLVVPALAGTVFVFQLKFFRK